MNWAAIIWFGLLLGFLILEAACPIHLVSIWFAAGSLVAMIIAFLHGPVWLQITLFAVVSVGLLIAMLPFVKKVLNPGVVKTNVDALVEEKCYVTAAIDNITATGQVKLNGMEWTARSTSGQTIEAGTLVKVDKIEGVKVFVTPVPIKEEVSL